LLPACHLLCLCLIRLHFMLPHSRLTAVSRYLCIRSSRSTISRSTDGVGDLAACTWACDCCGNAFRDTKWTRLLVQHHRALLWLPHSTTRTG
jgi:hypothetical protein